MFQVGNQYGKMSKRGKALDKEMRERIKQLANGLIDSIDIDKLTSNQRVNMLKALLPYLLPKELSINGEVVNEEEQEIKPPAVIVFGDSKEYKAYNQMCEEEKDKMVEEATPLFSKVKN
jgi:hypothetical protein